MQLPPPKMGCWKMSKIISLSENFRPKGKIATENPKFEKNTKKLKF